jgi:hypothetical protein
LQSLDFLHNFKISGEGLAQAARLAERTSVFAKQTAVSEAFLPRKPEAEITVAQEVY